MEGDPIHICPPDVLLILLVTGKGKMLNVRSACTEPVQGSYRDCSTRWQPWVFLPDAFPRQEWGNFPLIALRCGPLEVNQHTVTQAAAMGQ